MRYRSGKGCCCCSRRESDSQESFIYSSTDFHFSPWVLRANQYKWRACIMHTASFSHFFSLVPFDSRFLSLAIFGFDYSYKHHLDIRIVGIWDIDSVYGVRDGGIRETRVTRLLWRVPTTAIALSDWNGVPEGVWNITKSPSPVYISPRLIQTKRCNRE